MGHFLRSECCCCEGDSAQSEPTPRSVRRVARRRSTLRSDGSPAASTASVESCKRPASRARSAAPTSSLTHNKRRRRGGGGGFGVAAAQVHAREPRQRLEVSRERTARDLHFENPAGVHSCGQGCADAARRDYSRHNSRAKGAPSCLVGTPRSGGVTPPSERNLGNEPRDSKAEPAGSQRGGAEDDARRRETCVDRSELRVVLAFVSTARFQVYLIWPTIESSHTYSRRYT